MQALCHTTRPAPLLLQVLQRKLDGIRRPAYLGRLHLLELDMGAAVPLVSGCRVVQGQAGQQGAGTGPVWPHLELQVRPGMSWCKRPGGLLHQLGHSDGCQSKHIA
jgi:hypothetical protein